MKNRFLQLSRRAALLRLSLALVVIAMPACVSLADTTQPIKVACVGDSITYGAGLKNRDTESYPVWLGRWLGPEYDVKNFGRSGATLLRVGDLP